MVKRILSKKFWQSKTVWINALALIGGIATAISGELAIGTTLTIGSVANIILRIVTKLEIK
jgi:hypothetical protein